MEKIKVITRDGKTISLSEWQKQYGLVEGSIQIGKFFGLGDAKIAQDLKEYGELIVNELLIRVLDEFRKEVELPVTINSFNRNEAKQQALKAQGYRTATTSPHVAKMAADIDTTSNAQTIRWVQVLRSAARTLGIKIRIGYNDYMAHGQTFIHFDVCPEYYAPGKTFHGHPHPLVWEKETEW